MPPVPQWNQEESSRWKFLIVYFFMNFVHTLSHIFKTTASIPNILDVSALKVTLEMEIYALGTYFSSCKTWIQSQEGSGRVSSPVPSHCSVSDLLGFHHFLKILGVFDFMQHCTEQSASDLKRCMPFINFFRIEMSLMPCYWDIWNQSIARANEEQ